MAVTFGLGFGAQTREAFRRLAIDPDELEHHPGWIMFSGRTTASNSSLVT